MSIQVTFHKSTYPDTVEKKIKESISNHRLPARLLYESVGQASRWMNYARAWAPVHRDKEIKHLYNSLYQSVLIETDDKAFQYLSLGCGDGIKDFSFLQLAASRRLFPEVTLMDVSPSLILRAAQRLNAWHARLLVVDLESEAGMTECCQQAGDQTCTISCLGMLPTLGHERLLPFLSSVLREKDQLILSANLSPADTDEDKTTIRLQYDNPEAHAWYAGVLLELGLQRNDFMLDCKVVTLQEVTGAYRIVVHARMLRELELSVYGETYLLNAGDQLEVFRSERWTPDALRSRLKELGLNITHAMESNDCQEGVYCVTRG